MNLTVLFWFYKEPEICENRLQLLRKYNSDLKIFGLYGGKQQNTELFQNKIGKYLDDFYTSPYVSKAYKWYYGDFQLLDWYKKRGKFLDWDSFAIIQWDALVFTSLINLFAGIKKGEIFLSGLRTLSKTIENRWDWTSPKEKQRKSYLKFLENIKQHHHYNEKVLCWLAIIALFPRVFFEKYQNAPCKSIGFLEYKIPTYSKIFGIPFYKKDLGVWWDTYKNPGKPLNAVPEEIETEYIKRELKKENGWRVFHPYFKLWDLTPASYPRE